MKYSSSQLHFILKELLLSFIIFGAIYLLFYPIFEIDGFIFIVLILSISPFLNSTISYFFKGVRAIIFEKNAIQLFIRQNQKNIYHKNELEFFTTTSYGLKLKTQDRTFLFYRKSFSKEEWKEIERKLAEFKKTQKIYMNTQIDYVFKPEYTKDFYITPVILSLLFLSLVFISRNAGPNNYYLSIILLILVVLPYLLYSYRFPTKISFSESLIFHRFLFKDRIISYEKIYDISEQTILTNSGHIIMKSMENGYILADQLAKKLKELGFYHKNIKNEQVVKEKIHGQVISITMIIVMMCIFLLMIFKFFIHEIYLVFGFIVLYTTVYFFVKLRLKSKT